MNANDVYERSKTEKSWCLHCKLWCILSGKKQNITQLIKTCT